VETPRGGPIIVRRTTTTTPAPKPTTTTTPIPKPTTTTTSAPKPVKWTAQDVLRIISNGTAGVYISFDYGKLNYDNAGRPVNIYKYGTGHGDGLTADNQHPGIDIWMPDETPVNCLWSGRVICAGTAGSEMWGQGCGYFSDDNGGIGNITILHDAYAIVGGKRRQLKLTYGHMSSATVKPGDRVTAGQRIGRSGKGGDWPHVHLDVVVEAPELNNPQIWNNPGSYHLVNPMPTILAATADKPPSPPPSPPPGTGLVLPVATLPFTDETPFRATGSLSVERTRAILAAVDSPMAPEAAAIVAATPGLTALPLAQSYKESRYALDQSAQRTNNPLGLLWYSGMLPVMPVDTNNSAGVPLIIFPSYAAAFAEWFRRMNDPAYKSGVYMPREMTLGQFIRIYVAGPGPGYANGESAASVALYLGQTRARVNRYNGINQPDPLWGDSGSVPGIGIPLRKMIAPVGNRNRPGTALTNGSPDWITVHETANPNIGAGARTHAQFVRDGGGSESVSFHLTVDDREAYQMLPFDEIGWHAGDGCDSRPNDLGCFDSIAIETCVNADGDWNKTLDNLVELLVWLVRGGGGPNLSVDRIRQHNAWSGKNCPAIIRRTPGLWEKILSRVAARV
jgi:murein DD-endopeptidase MepM/ murein hydrolase activator NlpD